MGPLIDQKLEDIDRYDGAFSMPHYINSHGFVFVVVFLFCILI